MKIPRIKYIIPFSYCVECRRVMHKSKLRWRREFPWDVICSSNRYCKNCAGQDIASRYLLQKACRSMWDRMYESFHP